MLPILTIFIVFIFLLTYYTKKNEKAQSQVTKDFWDREHRANAIRKQDISKLDYITIPFEKIPQKLETSVEKEFFALEGKPMLNLTGLSNTDLKLTYGTANLTELSEYDTNFTHMVALLPEYTAQLLDAGQEDVAQMLLEFAVDHNADSRKIYSQLAGIYLRHQNGKGLAALKTASENLPNLTRLAVQKELEGYSC